MSEFRNTIRDIVDERIVGTGEQCLNLRTGLPFMAEVLEIEQIELNTELGRDKRESVLMYTNNSDQVAIAWGDQIQISLYGVDAKFKVLREKNNPASSQTEYGLMQLTDKDK